MAGVAFLCLIDGHKNVNWIFRIIYDVEGLVKDLNGSGINTMIL